MPRQSASAVSTSAATRAVAVSTGGSAADSAELSVDGSPSQGSASERVSSGKLASSRRAAGRAIFGPKTSRPNRLSRRRSRQFLAQRWHGAHDIHRGVQRTSRRAKSCSMGKPAAHSHGPRPDEAHLPMAKSELERVAKDCNCIAGGQRTAEPWRTIVLHP